MRTLINVDPTPEQLVILADTAPGFRLIRGAAGSGKTTAALLRLRQLCASRLSGRQRSAAVEPVRVLVLTFNQTLRGYVAQLAEEQIESNGGLELTIDTFGRWAWHLAGQPSVWNDDEADRRAPSLLRTAGVAQRNMDYFVDEIKYLTGRFTPSNRQDYIGVERTGRGRAPVVNRELRARLLREVVEPYEELKAKAGVSDWNDVAITAASAPGKGYDVVVVDEAQDFSANMLRAVRAHLSPDHSTTFIMDAVQRIYPRGFTWREVGIDMRPQLVINLTQNHRNTAEIARFAASLVQGLPQDEDGVLPDSQACQCHGPKPQVIAGLYSAQIDYMLNRVQPFIKSGDTVAILQPRGGRWFDHVKDKLRRCNIDYCVLTRSSNWPTGPEQVALSTIHSAKGLEFDHVLIPGLNREVTLHGEEEGDGTLDSLRRLVAMGIGRARHTVMLGYKPGEQSTLIELLDPASYDSVQV